MVSKMNEELEPVGNSMRLIQKEEKVYLIQEEEEDEASSDLR